MERIAQLRSEVDRLEKAKIDLQSRVLKALVDCQTPTYHLVEKTPRPKMSHSTKATTPFSNPFKFIKIHNPIDKLKRIQNILAGGESHKELI